MQQWICTAMSTIRVVSFAYESTWFVVEPYVYGTREDDVDVMIGYVLTSSNDQLPKGDWKVFETGKIGARAINYDAMHRDRQGMPDVPLKATYCELKQKTKK